MSQDCFDFKKEKDKYFATCQDPLQNICLIPGCSSILKGNVNANLKRHIINKHKDVAVKVRLIHDSAIEDENVPSPNKKNSIAPSAVFLKAIVGLSTKFSLPFTVFDSKEFRVICDTSKIEKLGIALNSKNVINILKSTSTNVKTFIRSEVKNNVISLKIDSASRLGRHIFGINCQFLKKGEICIRTLAMLEIYRSQTSETLKSIVLDVLDDYGIQLNQILSITSDNGKNMIKSSELLKETQNQIIQDSESDASELFDTEDDSESEDVSEEDREVRTLLEGQVNDVFEKESNLILKNIESALAGIMVVIRCAAHTIQLAVWEVIKCADFSKKIDKFRSFAKGTRSTKYKKLISSLKITKPVSDGQTRWGSTFLMIQSVLKNKQFYVEYGIAEDLKFSEDDWNFGIRFLDAFGPAFVLTKKLQSECLLLTDVYKFVLECEISIAELNETNEMKQPLLNAINKRKIALFENVGFTAALYMDPRFTYLGTPFFPNERYEQTIEYLSNLWKTIQIIQETDLSSQQGENFINPSPEAQSPLEKFILSKSQRTNTTVMTHENQLMIERKLRNLLQGIRSHSSTNLIDYWNQKRIEEPQLYRIAMTLFSIPATQVSVERCFSSLPLILTRLRNGLCKTNLENVLFVRLNYDLIETNEVNCA